MIGTIIHTASDDNKVNALAMVDRIENDTYYSDNAIYSYKGKAYKKVENFEVVPAEARLCNAKEFDIYYEFFPQKTIYKNIPVEDEL